MLSAEADARDMNLSMLLEDALAERGNAVAVIDHPTDGEHAIIRSANAPFARIMGWPVDSGPGLGISELRPLIEQPEDWALLISAVRTLSPLSLDLKLRVNGRTAFLGFNLTFGSTAGDNIRYGVLIGRDITERRERTMRETESQRLLASVFLRVSAAVAIVSDDGAILMANPACQRLLGYGPAELAGVNIDALIPPELAEAMHTARANHSSDGGGFVMRLDTVMKNGSRVPVTLNSEQLRDARDRRLHVVTLIPDPMPRDAPAAEVRVEPSDAGQVRAISLAALKAAYGSAWPRIADRAMMSAEQIIKRRLGSVDVFSRHNDHSFLIWFESVDEVRNHALLARTVREIRLRFLTEASEDVPEQIDVISIGAEAIPSGRSGVSSTTPAQTAPDRRHGERLQDETEARALLRELRTRAVADVRPVTGREGKRQAVVMVDFSRDVRRRIYDLRPSLPDEPDRGTGLDLIRLDLAIQELAIRREEEVSVLVPIAWPALAETGCRLLVDERLVRMRPDSRSYLMLAISDVPLLVSAKRWSDTIGPLQRQLGEVGLLLSRRDGDLAPVRDAIIGTWPLTLLVIDGTEGQASVSDVYFSLIAAARRRDISVLVRSGADELRDWRELGATMFVAER